MLCLAPDGAGAVTAAPRAAPESQQKSPLGRDKPGQAGTGWMSIGTPRSFRSALSRQPGEEAELSRKRRGHRGGEVREGGLRQHPAARGALDEPLLHEV